MLRGELQNVFRSFSGVGITSLLGFLRIFKLFPWITLGSFLKFWMPRKVYGISCVVGWAFPRCFLESWWGYLWFLWKFLQLLLFDCDSSRKPPEAGDLKKYLVSCPREAKKISSGEIQKTDSSLNLQKISWEYSVNPQMKSAQIRKLQGKGWKIFETFRNIHEISFLPCNLEKPIKLRFRKTSQKYSYLFFSNSRDIPGQSPEFC